MISPENYLRVRGRYEERLEKMIGYADSEQRCRSVVLLDYFGEESEACGKCDVCKSLAAGSGNEDFETIKAKIREITEVQDTDVQELVRIIDYPGEKVIDVIRRLLDAGMIRKTPDNRLSWKI
jgi:ATP-dependent DNA helicase RecQ